jgi:hypothetical protein
MTTLVRAVTDDAEEFTRRRTLRVGRATGAGP